MSENKQEYYIIDPETGDTIDMRGTDPDILEGIMYSYEGNSEDADRIGVFLYQNYMYSKREGTYTAFGAYD